MKLFITWLLLVLVLTRWYILMHWKKIWSNLTHQWWKHDDKCQDTDTDRDFPVFAVKWDMSLTCSKWDCDCPFNRQRGCCCAANEMYQVEDESFDRIKCLWEKIMSLNSRVNALSGTPMLKRIKYCMRAWKCSCRLVFDFSTQVVSRFPSRPPWIRI